MSIVAIWRTPVEYEGGRSLQVDDPTGSEPALRAFERHGDPAHYVRSVAVRGLA